MLLQIMSSVPIHLQWHLKSLEIDRERGQKRSYLKGCLTWWKYQKRTAYPPPGGHSQPLTGVDFEPSPPDHEKVKHPAPPELLIPPTYFPSALSLDSAELFPPSTKPLSTWISRCLSTKELDSSPERIIEFPGASYENTVHHVLTDPRPATPLGVLNTAFPYPSDDHGLSDPLFKPGVYLDTLK
ncbi:hypothetical protein DSL72_003512 [Monilinia vaccinii-corymbosi]|uniref:Uncharacterized protein n=1 Tax=Monilinia vaccinii-corymbosi TaxID=61207 RepID=A0A8A3NU72_9HELO|nr:hypothetical protein DSL72_003512 [Monilinia vaccinii-corymbosi]